MTSTSVTTDPASCQAYPDPIPGIIPFGALCIFSGASGVGKTVLKAEWCRRLLDGRPILGVQTNRPTALYYLAADRPWHPTYAAAFAAAAVDTTTELHYYSLLDDPTYDPRILKARNHSAFEFLVTCLEKLKPSPGSVLCIDPMAPLFISGDQNNAKDVALSLHWLRRQGQLRQVTLICDANVTKLKMDEDFKRPQDRISGSGAFLAYADTQFNFSEDGKDPNGPRTLVWKPRQGPAGEQKFSFDQATKLFVPFKGLQDEAATAEDDRPTQCYLLLPEDGTPLSREEWYERVTSFVAEISMGTFQRDIRKLLERRLIIRDAFGKYARRKLS